MSRTEDNANMIMYFAKATEEAKSGTYEEMVNWNIGVISLVLMDISKSMAMIADNTNRASLDQQGESEDKVNVNEEEPCRSCNHTEEDCKWCYAELGHKNDKLKRDTEAVEEFAKQLSMSNTEREEYI